MIRNSNRLKEGADQLSVQRLKNLAPRPRSIEDTGLSREFLADLTAKHLLSHGALHLARLSQLLMLSGSLVETILDFMRSEAKIEVRPGQPDKPGLVYALTDRGRSTALDAFLRSGYIGPAPVPVEHYVRVAASQSVHGQQVTRSDMAEEFHDVVIDDELLDRLGASMNSGRAVFVYGSAGTGKTYVSKRLSRIFPGVVLIPHAISVDENVVQIFDPLVHKVVDLGVGDESYLLDRGHDPRFLVCERPAVITGGELTQEMLEVKFDPAAKTFEAPLQLKANNGVFIIDDLGRQRIDPKMLFNRWIVPLEERRDFLHLSSGRHFSVPFDMVLVFSTNIHPLDLADEAFLRRIGYKIEFTPLSAEAYERIWRDTCVEHEVDFEPEVLNFVINELYSRKNVDLLPCHPRDLIGMAVDHTLYTGAQRGVDVDSIRWAWDNYFVSISDSCPTANLKALV